ncbi:MAG: LysR substrate-binding domain-containing protein [Bacteroidales bacterium]|nr:LysR substrate-binding domain-containing protein [Bacteroidales bacterium]
MTIQQLEYIVAVDKYRHFVKASKACKITQSTLSSMIQKLESELNITIFDRNVHPVKPTKIGINVINQAKIILHNFNQLKEMVLSEREQTIGKINLGIIPTIAPYILPKLFEELKIKYPGLKMHVSEIRTNEIIESLQKAELDMAILATPLEINDLFEIPLYYEKFVAYVSPSEPLFNMTEINPSEMPTKHMWLLQEGHCLRKQIFNFCEKKSDYSSIYEAGSIDTLVKIVDKNGGYTIIPELHIELLDKSQQKNIRQFSSPQPMREISLVVRQDYVREKILNIIAEAIKTIIPEHMIDSRLKKFAIKL